MSYKPFLYAQRDHTALGEYFTDHMEGLTAEGLRAKSAIAAELAHRDLMIDTLRAEVERLTREAAEWQPIETAPRGPACLFLIVPKSEEETWTDSSERPITAHGEPYIVMGPYGQWGSLWKATHWMPLPRAPAGTPHCPTCGCGDTEPVR